MAWLRADGRIWGAIAGYARNRAAAECHVYHKDDVNHIAHGVTIQVPAVKMRTDQIPDRSPATAKDVVNNRSHVQDVNASVITGDIPMMRTIARERICGNRKRVCNTLSIRRS